MIHRFSPVVVPALAVALAGCAGDAPTESLARPPAAQAQSLAMSGETLDALRGTVSDARERLLPAIGDAQTQSRLSAALGSVAAALEANDAGALSQSLDAARAVLSSEVQALGDASPAAADFDALSLTLDNVARALPQEPRSF